MNLTRNAMPTGGNVSRSGIITPSHIWDEENTPWNPDNTLPWQDNATMPPEFDINGTPLSRNATPLSTSINRN